MGTGPRDALTFVGPIFVEGRILGGIELGRLVHPAHRLAQASRPGAEVAGGDVSRALDSDFGELRPVAKHAVEGPPAGAPGQQTIDRVAYPMRRRWPASSTPPRFMVARLPGCPRRRQAAG